MVVSLIALMLFQQPFNGHVVSVEQVDKGQAISGSDYLLIAEAARHPEMRDALLSCYRIYVRNAKGHRRVAFVEARNRVVEKKTETGTEITHLPPDPKCRSIEFEMGPDGRVAKVFHSRH